MPQISKGGKFVFGWSVIRDDYSMQIPSQAIQEYDICSESKVYLISGSKTTGGFNLSKRTLLEKSVFENVFKEYPNLKSYKTQEGNIFHYKGREYSWLNISERGKIYLNEEILRNLSLKINDKLLVIRSSDIAFSMGLKGPVIEAANNYEGHIDIY